MEEHHYSSTKNNQIKLEFAQFKHRLSEFLLLFSSFNFVREATLSYISEILVQAADYIGRPRNCYKYMLLIACLLPDLTAASTAKHILRHMKFKIHIPWNSTFTYHNYVHSWYDRNTCSTERLHDAIDDIESHVAIKTVYIICNIRMNLCDSDDTTTRTVGGCDDVWRIIGDLIGIPCDAMTRAMFK